MAANLVLGALLVGFSWAVITLLVCTYGRWIEALVTSKHMSRETYEWRRGLWWGLTFTTITTLALSFITPLASSTAAGVVLSGALALGATGIVMRRPLWPSWRRSSSAVIVWLAMAWLAVAYIAFKALGPVTNYDSGLYHLGSIKYTADYSVVPGLANLYFPFGYANAQFPLAALLGNGPWDGIGYRLLNGAVLVLVLMDLSARLLKRQWSWGTFTLFFGLSATFIPMVAMADDMVTSPTSDTSVMLLTLVSASYLADALQERASGQLDAGIATTVAGLTVAFRPTMIIFAISVAAIAISFIRRGRSGSVRHSAPWAISGLLLSVLALVSLLRDRMLSGWLFYPLSNFPLAVPWRAEDPAPWRIGTLAAARNPDSQDGFQTAHSYDWIASWFARLPNQWEPWFLLVGFLIMSISVAIAWRAGVMKSAWRPMLTAVLPSSLAVLAWFLLSPPSFRFIWGPAFVLLVLPMGVAFAQLGNLETGIKHRAAVTQLALVGGAFCIGTVAVFSVVERNQFDTISQERSWRLGPVSAVYTITPVPTPATKRIDTGNGLILQTPVSGDQCWDNYPLCVYYTGQSVSARGQVIQDGFDRE